MAGVVLTFAAAAWFIFYWCMANSAVQRADTAELALYLTQLAPSDPQAHHRAAVLLEKNFDIENVQQAVVEYELAAALSPENYMMWLDLGRALERSGDPEGAERALRRALELAPNYSRVQWGLGNALLRQGRVEEAFGHIGRSVTGDDALSGMAAVTAWQFFDGDLAAIRRAITGSVAFDAALATHLAREKRFDEAIVMWDSLPANAQKGTLKQAGITLRGLLLEAKRFRQALRVAATLDDQAGEPGVVNNGGFEQPVKPDTPGPFEWQITPGLQPQIVLTTAQKHGGDKSLLVIFNSADGKEFRPVAQTIAVEPGRSYTLELYYRTELKTNASFSWEVLDATDGKLIAAGEPIAGNTDWRSLVIRFVSNASSDGVIIRFTRAPCTAVCPVAGNIWFDDVSLQQRN